MQSNLVWDVPVRLFHAVFGLTFLGAYGLANFAEEEEPAFPLHMLFGLLMGAAVVLRVLWGLLGTRYARFGSFAFGSSAVKDYLRDVFARRPVRFVGHNPGSSLAIFAMLLLALGLVVTGVMLGRGNESVEDVHGVLSHVFLAVVVAHITGVIVHTVLARDNISASMVHGRKAVAPSEAIPSSRGLVAVFFIAAMALAATGLAARYDPRSRSLELPLLGRIQSEDESEHGHEHEHHEAPSRGHDAEHGEGRCGPPPRMEGAFESG
jgi:cytochrome b